MKRTLFSLLFIILLCHCGKDDREGSTETTTMQPYIFDMPFKERVSLDTSSFDDLFPIELVAIKKNMSEHQVVQLLGNRGAGILESPYFGRTPAKSYLELVGIQYESGKITSISVTALRLPPTKGRIRRLVMQLERLLGPPMVSRHSRDGSAESSVMLDWQHEPDLLRLSIKRDGGLLDVSLDYFPGPNNRALQRTNEFWKPRPIHVEKFDAFFDSFLDRLGFFHPGDGPTPPIVIPSDQLGMLQSLGKQVVSLQPESHDSITLIAPFKKDLLKALNEKYAHLENQEAYAHLSEILRGGNPRFSDGAAQVGAALYLSSKDDVDVFEYLLPGLKVGLPQGVSMACITGLANNCRGDAMDKVLEMLSSRSSQSVLHAKWILGSLPSRKHTDELRTKVEGLQSEEIRSICSEILKDLEVKHGR